MIPRQVRQCLFVGRVLPGLGLLRRFGNLQDLEEDLSELTRASSR